MNGVLETISLALFHTASPIQPPPLRGTSFHRKEGVSTRAPSLGRGCRAQRSGVGFLFRRRSRLLFAFPIGEGVVLRKAVDRVLSQTAYLRRFLFPLYHLLETIFFALFHTARTLSGSLRSPPSPLGKGNRVSGARVLSYNGALETIFFALFHTARTLSGSLRSPPSPRGEGFAGGNGILVSSSIPHKNDRLLRAAVFMCITCLGKR